MSENMALHIKPEDIVIFHIGGSEGSCGPTDAITTLFPKQCVLFCFEARETTEDIMMVKTYTQRNIRTVLVNRCIAKTTGKVPFFVNKHGESSSLLRPSEIALTEHLAYSDNIHTWGENTELEREIILNAISLKDFIGLQYIVPDVLSIDAQGAEMDIMQGLGQYISEINCIVTEVEFLEIYTRQGLFHDQMAFLTSAGFRLADLLNSQYWHPGPVCGRGFYTVAEALWFRRLPSFTELNANKDDFFLRGIKLTAVAFSFQRYSYAYTLMKRLMTLNSDMVTNLCHKHNFTMLLQLVADIDRHLNDYTRDNLFFLKHPVWGQAELGNSQGLLSRTVAKVGAKILRHIPI